MSNDKPIYQFYHRSGGITDERTSEIMFKIMELRPHCSDVYTWDDLGMANLMADIYSENLCYCLQEKAWYVWDERWVKQPDDGELFDSLETVLNLLLIYCKEQTWLIQHDEQGDEDEIAVVEEYCKFVKSLRKRTPMKHIIETFTMKVRRNLADFDSNPYILNTTYLAYDLRTGKPIENLQEHAVTMQTRTHLPDFLTHRCDRWYQFIDEIMSHDKEKAAFLQRALGYSLLGVNKDECMFIAYGAKSRNGKGTLFRALENALGSDYIRSTSPKLICEKRNGDSVDYNSPQPMLCALIGARIVSMSEAQQSARLDSAAMKAMTGRDTLTTRGLYEGAFSFIPQFTLWVNTNYLPVVNDDTVFLSDRIWVIEFNEKFDGENRDNDLKDLFADPENLPTILGWLMDGCRDYMEHGLNPPDCVRKATANYRNQNDRIGRFIDECCDQEDGVKTVRGEIYQAYRMWCNSGDNRFKPVGSTTFYAELSVRGYAPMKSNGDWVVPGLKPKNVGGNRIAL